MRRQHLAARAPRARRAGRRARHLRPARPADRLGRADAVGAGGRPRRRDAVSRCAVEGPQARQDLGERGTLHLLRADELGLWVGAQSALKPRHHVGSWLRHHGLTREQADAMLDAIPVALDGHAAHARGAGRPRSRALTGIKGLDDKLKGGFGDLLKPAAFRGDLCFAPSDGQRVRFARPDQWLGPWKPVRHRGGDARGHSPLPDALRARPIREALARWFGMPSPAEAGRWLKRLGDEAVEVDGKVMLAADAERSRRRSRTARCGSCRPSTSTSSRAPRDDDDVVVRRQQRARVYRPQALAVAGTARRRPHGRRVVARAQGRPAGRRDRAVRAAAPRRAAPAPRPRRRRSPRFLGGELELRLS